MFKMFLRKVFLLIFIVGSMQADSNTVNSAQDFCPGPSASQIGASILLVGVLGTYSLLAVREDTELSHGCGLTQK